MEGEFSPRVPATWLDPPEGGDLERLEWHVEDIDEVLLYLELRTEGFDEMVRAHWRRCGRLPRVLVDRIERDWNLEIHAQQAYWEERP